MRLIFRVVFILVLGLWKIAAMEYKNNGGYKIPVVGLVKTKDAINEALNLGYRHIDTATLYKNEELIGEVLKEWIFSGKLKREDLFITTKLSPMDLFPDRTENAIKTSLEKLQLNYVDLWLIHHPVAVKVNHDGSREEAPTDLIGVWKKMEEQVDTGRVRNIGLSNFNITQIKRIQKEARIKPTNLQVEIHPYFQQLPIRNFALENNITVVAYSSFGHPGLARDGRPDVKSFNILADEHIKKIAKKYNRSPAQIVLKFLTQSDIVVIPKSSNPKRLKENIEIFNFILDKDDMKTMEGLDRGKDGRIFDNPRMRDHPEYPFHDELIPAAEHH